MIAIEQTFTPYLTGAKSFIHTMIGLHQFKEFVVKYWIRIVIVSAIVGLVIYAIKKHNRTEKERIQKVLEKINNTEVKPNNPQQITNQLLNRQ